MRDPPFQLENRAEWRQRQDFEVRLLLGEGLIDDALSRGVHARTGYAIEPITQLGVQIVEIAACRAAGRPPRARAGARFDPGPPIARVAKPRT